uniref:Exocyst complex component Sec6 n=1 Tax=Plectus sambesii TaxID=2011161 RepID=A0A914WGJ5_9BILA
MMEHNFRYFQDWYKTVHPEQDSSGYYYTALPAILFQMVEDQVQLAKEISADIVPNVVFVNVEELLALAGRYKDAAIAYKNKHFEDRSRFELFTPITIAMANNFDICVDSTDKVKKHVRLTMETDMATPRGAAGGVNRQELLEKIDQLKLKWSAGCQTAETSLLEEISQDMAPHLAEIMTKKWASGGGALETICATIADYHMDYKHLRPHIMCVLLMDLQYKVLGEYLKAIENRRITFANFDERNAAADRLKQEARRMESLFKTMTQGVNIEFEYLMDVLPALADVLSLRDKGLLALEVSGLVRKFPDITVDHLSAIIQLREDTGRADARSLAEEIIQQNKYHPKGNAAFVKLFQSGKSEEKRLRDFDFASLTLGGLSRLS